MKRIEAKLKKGYNESMSSEPERENIIQTEDGEILILGESPFGRLPVFKFRNVADFSSFVSYCCKRRDDFLGVSEWSSRFTDQLTEILERSSDGPTAS